MEGTSSQWNLAPPECRCAALSVFNLHRSYECLGLNCRANPEQPKPTLNMDHRRHVKRSDSSRVRLQLRCGTAMRRRCCKEPRHASQQADVQSLGSIKQRSLARVAAWVVALRVHSEVSLANLGSWRGRTLEQWASARRCRVSSFCSWRGVPMRRQGRCAHARARAWRFRLGPVIAEGQSVGCRCHLSAVKAHPISVCAEFIRVAMCALSVRVSRWSTQWAVPWTACLVSSKMSAVSKLDQDLRPIWSSTVILLPFGLLPALWDADRSGATTHSEPQAPFLDQRWPVTVAHGS